MSPLSSYSCTFSLSPFQMRNKLNEQQHSKLAAHREVLGQRKDEMNYMDRRIAELQERLRRKRAQQQAKQENANNLANQNKPPISNKSTGRPMSANVAAVEPYIKYAPKEPIRNEVQDLKNFGPSKQDPKYQTLPYNVKLFSTSEQKKSKDDQTIYNPYSGVPQPPVVAANVQVADPKAELRIDTNMGDKPNPAQAPHLRPSPQHSPSYGNNGKPPMTAYDQIRPATAPKPPLSVSHFTPRPYGSSYNTPLTSRAFGPILVGSGASSPASSDASSSPGGLIQHPKTSTPITAVTTANNRPIPAISTNTPTSSMGAGGNGGRAPTQVAGSEVFITSPPAAQVQTYSSAQAGRTAPNYHHQGQSYYAKQAPPPPPQATIVAPSLPPSDLRPPYHPANGRLQSSSQNSPPIQSPGSAGRLQPGLERVPPNGSQASPPSPQDKGAPIEPGRVTISNSTIQQPPARQTTSAPYHDKKPVPAPGPPPSNGNPSAPPPPPAQCQSQLPAPPTRTLTRMRWMRG